MAPKVKRVDAGALKNSTTLTVTETARNFSDVINRARYLGATFILTKGGEPVAEIRPLPSARVRTAGDFALWLKTLPALGADADAFARDVEDLRAKLAPLGADPRA